MHINCGCGRLAEYEVYDHREPHCHQCMMDAISGKYQVPVRRLEVEETYLENRMGNEKLVSTYNKAPVGCHPTTKWVGEGKEAFQDGITTTLDMLGIKIEGLNE
ncbi:hypothetical protein [Paenibacillus sp. FSL L8-0708]|uniref:hypothetical protein n=1 Tax=Paenibacillus sp. FSL L8-0708 TaxID=2975311 RepID=UPI0030FACCC1